jgi:filamentous hemagglutinin family protein
MKHTMKWGIIAIAICVYGSGGLLIGQEEISPTALPQGGVVVGGVADLETNENRHFIRAKTERVAVRYIEGFNIGVRGVVDVEGLPGGAALIQDANTRGNLSHLHGNLNSNIDVLILNPNGILIGKDFKLDTKGLTIGALQGVADDFMKREEMNLKQASTEARIVNEGAVLNRDVILLAPRVEDRAAQAVHHVGSDFLIQLRPRDRSEQAIKVRLPDVQGSVLKANQDQLYAQAMNIEGMPEERIRISRDGRIHVKNVTDRSTESSAIKGANPPLITVNQKVEAPRGLADVNVQRPQPLDVTEVRKADPVVVKGAIVANPKPSINASAAFASAAFVEPGLDIMRTARELSQEMTFKDFPKQSLGQVVSERRRATIKINEPDLDSSDDRGVVTVEPLPASVLTIQSASNPSAPKIQITNTEIALDREDEDAGQVDVLPVTVRR